MMRRAIYQRVLVCDNVFLAKEDFMIPFILSGGSGTRLWPVSRASYPKQFCEFYDNSFLKSSLQRVASFGQPSILTIESMKAMTERTLKEMGYSSSQVYYEPFGKNTGPAIALICHILNMSHRGEEVVGIFPADHLITNQKVFEETLQLGIQQAEKGEVVTLGIQARYPATGYGYIQVKEGLTHPDESLKAFEVEQFCEKPDLKKAEEFISTGKHFWNSGIFIFKVSKMIEHMKKHLPEVWQKISEIKQDFSNAKYSYANVDSISIDYGIMEKLERLVCIPCDFGWSDVGSWDELSRLAEERPEYRAVSEATVFSEEATANYVFSVKPKVVGLIGVRNLIVVDTPDALLISQKGQTQKVKEIVDQVKLAGLPEATDHPFEVRPWGGFEILSDNEQFKAKKITVQSGEQLSYQSHQKRDEHWIVISGDGEVTLDNVKTQYSAGEHIFIPREAKHRIKNIGSSPLVFVEVQVGIYFGEDDIVRYQDDYNRVK